ncbi:MAG: hypothetical protein ACJ77K_17540 [Bacteroidia bacterium]
MVKLSIFIILGFAALVTMIGAWLRNRSSKREGDDLVRRLQHMEINVTDFVKLYQIRINTFPIEPDKIDERTVEQRFSTAGKMGKFELLHFQKIRKGEFLFITRSFIDDFVMTSAKSTRNVQHFDTYVFTLKLRPESIEVCSDFPPSNESKFVRSDFAKLAFAHLRNN